MKKTVIVINGAGGVGKDTLCEIAASVYKVKNVSSIDPIKQIARMCHWNGQKDDRSRKFLSDLKRLTSEYNDFPTLWAKERYDEFLAGDEELMFVHIREGGEIGKFVRATDGAARTLLVRGGARFTKDSYGNASDDGVEDYPYDYYFVNDRPLEQTAPLFLAFLSEIINGQKE